MRHPALALLTALALAGCVETAGTPQAVEVPASAAPTVAPAAATLQIADMVVPSRNFTATEAFAITFKVKVPGTGKLVAYWLSTKLGEQRYPIETPLPVIANGAVELTAAGPLPFHRQAGRFEVEFWVEDEGGAQSNSLVTEVNVQ